MLSAKQEQDALHEGFLLFARKREKSGKVKLGTWSGQAKSMLGQVRNICLVQAHVRSSEEHIRSNQEHVKSSQVK